MGITRFSGPVYGAKSQLWSIGPLTGSTSAASSALMGRTLVPAYERWYITEVAASCSTSSSGFSVLLKAKGGSTSADFPAGNAGTVGTVSFGGSTAGGNLLTTPTAQAGEYEGYAVTENSSLRLVQSTAVNPATLVCVSVRGFIRYIDSTRAV